MYEFGNFLVVLAELFLFACWRTDSRTLHLVSKCWTNCRFVDQCAQQWRHTLPFSQQQPNYLFHKTSKKNTTNRATTHIHRTALTGLPSRKMPLCQESPQFLDNYLRTLMKISVDHFIHAQKTCVKGTKIHACKMNQRNQREERAISAQLWAPSSTERLTFTLRQEILWVSHCQEHPRWDCRNLCRMRARATRGPAGTHPQNPRLTWRTECLHPPPSDTSSWCWSGLGPNFGQIKHHHLEFRWTEPHAGSSIHWSWNSSPSLLQPRVDPDRGPTGKRTRCCFCWRCWSLSCFWGDLCLQISAGAECCSLYRWKWDHLTADLCWRMSAAVVCPSQASCCWNCRNCWQLCGRSSCVLNPLPPVLHPGQSRWGRSRRTPTECACDPCSVGSRWHPPRTRLPRIRTTTKNPCLEQWPHLERTVLQKLWHQNHEHQRRRDPADEGWAHLPGWKPWHRLRGCNLPAQQGLQEPSAPSKAGSGIGVERARSWRRGLGAIVCLLLQQPVLLRDEHPEKWTPETGSSPTTCSLPKITKNTRGVSHKIFLVVSRGLMKWSEKKLTSPEPGDDSFSKGNEFEPPSPVGCFVVTDGFTSSCSICFSTEAKTWIGSEVSSAFAPFGSSSCASRSLSWKQIPASIKRLRFAALLCLSQNTDSKGSTSFDLQPHLAECL